MKKRRKEDEKEEERREMMDGVEFHGETKSRTKMAAY